MSPANDLFDESRSPLGGDPLALVDLERADPVPAPIRIGIDRAGSLPAVDPEEFDALVTVAEEPPAPWAGIASQRLEPALRQVSDTVRTAPIAATLLCRVLLIGALLPFAEALEIESLAYSTLLGGAEFRRWLSGRPTPGDEQTRQDPVRYERVGDSVTLTLASPENRNAMSATMRDALCEALANVRDDPSLPRLVLRGEGRCFSTGGHLPEFGAASDSAAAHAVRIRRSAAALLHDLGDRATVELHGACIGSGIEIPAAAAQRTGAGDVFVQLPELGMGLIPGAGGTVTLPAAIGRHRTAWMALGGFRVGARTALDWGLLHGIRA